MEDFLGVKKECIEPKKTTCDSTYTMKQFVFIFLISLLLYACYSARKVKEKDYGSPDITQELIDYNTFKINCYSQDITYGYTPDNPVMVGGATKSQGPLNERRFLNALSGPKGESVRYHRVGSCCDFRTENSFSEYGQLDMYRVTHGGMHKWVIIYINMYDSDELKVPKGFKIKQETL